MYVAAPPFRIEPGKAEAAAKVIAGAFHITDMPRWHTIGIQLQILPRVRSQDVVPDPSTVAQSVIVVLSKIDGSRPVDRHGHIIGYGSPLQRNSDNKFGLARIAVCPMGRHMPQTGRPRRHLIQFPEHPAKPLSAAMQLVLSLIWHQMHDLPAQLHLRGTNTIGHPSNNGTKIEGIAKVGLHVLITQDHRHPLRPRPQVAMGRHRAIVQNADAQVICLQVHPVQQIRRIFR